MNLGELLSALDWKSIADKGGAFLLIAMTIVQFSPIKVNPWSWIAKKIGRALNSEMIAKLEALRARLGPEG